MIENIKKVGLVSLGCPKNRVDSEIILGDMRRSGFEITPRESEAHIIIVNTCGFIDAAREESVDTILQMAEFKKKGCCETLVVTGCLSQKYREELLEQIPEIDFLFGTTNLGIISRILLRKGPSSVPEKKMWVDDPDLPPESGEGRVATTPGHSAYVKISEGCSSRCTFCIIPRLRGKYRSRPMESILREVNILAENAVKEINIVSQDTTLYGVDLGMKNGLSRLLGKIEKIRGIRWIRLLYCHPSLVDKELIRVVASSEKVCKYMDLPIQHSHDDMLMDMGRNETERTIRDLVEELRTNVPGIVLRTEIIVGFPGEKSMHFEHLSNFIREMKFDRVGVFSYSLERDTPSAGLSPRVKSATKERRVEEILKIQKKISYALNQRLVGTVQDVLVDGYGSRDNSEEAPLPLWEGRLAAQAPEIDGVVYLDQTGPGEIQPGEVRRVKLMEAGDYDFVGRILKK